MTEYRRAKSAQGYRAISAKSRPLSSEITNSIFIYMTDGKFNLTETLQLCQLNSTSLNLLSHFGMFN